MCRPKAQSSSAVRSAPSSDARCCDSLRKLAPAHVAQEPGHVRGRGRQRADHAALGARPGRTRQPARRRSGSPALVTRLAVVHGAVRQLRRGGGRGARQGAGGHAAQDAQGDHGAAARRRQGATRGGRPASSLRKGDLVVVEAGELIPGDGEIIEGIASVDESAITGESAPVIRESGGDRSAVTGGTKVLSDRIVVRITAEPGRVLPRPHDRAGRGRVAAEDAQRDRAAHPAGRADARLPVRLRDAGAAGALLGHRAVGDGDRRAAGLPDPDHHRRAAVGHRHRRHGSAAAQERASP